MNDLEGASYCDMRFAVLHGHVYHSNNTVRPLI